MTYQVSDNLTRKRESKLLSLAQTRYLLYLNTLVHKHKINIFSNYEHSKKPDIVIIPTTIYFFLNFALYILALLPLK